MLFRIVAPHTHRAFAGGETFTCFRRTAKEPSGLQITWAAYRGEVLLKNDCRTLNEAKRLCRDIGAEPR
jgi:hypothetical protein